MVIVLSILAFAVFSSRRISVPDARQPPRPPLYTRPAAGSRSARHAQSLLLRQGSGEPTVLFEAGIGATNLNWRHIQESIAQFTHTVSYDRGGLGWSSPCRTARTPGNIAPELHEMLRARGIKPPYILVGHSFGGLVMRRFALLYPEEVAGVVLVDPMRCEEWPPLDPAKQSQIDLRQKTHPLRAAGCALRFGAPAGHVALPPRRKTLRPYGRRAGAAPRHVLGRIKTEVGKMPREVWPAVAAHWSRPGLLRRHAQPH